MDEFEFIRTRLAPLAAETPGARGLTDDAGTIVPPEGTELVVTADTLVAGVHFRPDDPLDGVAHKALAVNVSDLVAKGADPLAYVLNLTWPNEASLEAKTRFVEGLEKAQGIFRAGLLGGDTTVGAGPLTISITAFGTVPLGGFIPRSGAQAGDRVFVTGAIGDGVLGLMALEGRLDALSAADREALIERYRRPTPRVELAAALRGRARAAIDVSDGLVADAGHVARTSGAAIRLRAQATPLSPAASRWLETQPDADRASALLATGGDDYQVLFTGPREAGEEVGRASGVAVTEIGVVEAGEGVALLGRDGQPLRLDRAGFTHF